MDHFDKIFEGGGQGSGSNGSGGGSGRADEPEEDTTVVKGYIDPFRIKKTGQPDFSFVSMVMITMVVMMLLLVVMINDGD